MTKSVAQWCQERNLSVDRLVDLSELDPNRVIAILEGRWTPSPAERNRIATALDVDIDQIAWGHKTPIQHLYGHGPG